MKYILLSFLVIGFLLLTSCQKKKDTIANIRVLGSDSQPVNQCMVVLYGTNSMGTPQQVSVYDTLYTNEDGIASFNFNYFYQLGKTGVAVLDIKAQKDIQVGFGNIKIESEVVNEETVIIQ
jgi:hypothetical protein